MNAITEVPAHTGLVPRSINEALQIAEFMARARTVPKHLQDSPGDCLMVVEQAMRWGMSPFAVAQATSVISGKMMYEGKLVAAAVETMGAIVGHFDYQLTGEGDARTITVSATRRGETNPRTVSVILKDARTNNEMWKRQPDQQLVYHGTRVWARRWTPAVILGVYSREEMGPVIEGQIVSDEPQPEPGTRAAVNAEVPLRAAAAPMPRAPRIAEKAPLGEPPPAGWQGYEAPDPLNEPDGPKWLRNLDVALANAQSQQEVMDIGGHTTVGNAMATAPDAIKARISELLARAYGKFAEPDLPDVEIAGQDKIGAG